MSNGRESFRPETPQKCGGLPASGYCGIDGYYLSMTGEICPTITDQRIGMKNTHGVLWRGHRTVSTTNSNGLHVMPTIASKSGPEWERETAPTLLATCYKDGGGHIFSFNFELYDPGQRECMGCIAARRAHDWLVYNR